MRHNPHRGIMWHLMHLATMIEDQPKLADHSDPRLRNGAIAFGGYPIVGEIEPLTELADSDEHPIDVSVHELIDRPHTAVKRDPAKRPSHRAIDVGTTQPKGARLPREHLDAEIDPHVKGDIVDAHVTDGEQPIIVDPQMTAQREVIEIGARPIGRAVVQRRPGLTVDPTDALGERCAQPDVKVGPCFDKQLAMAASLLNEMLGDTAPRQKCIILVGRAVTAAEPGRLGCGACLHRRGRNVTMPHESTASRPSARRYSATTMGSETRV
jgi:hypothetical protein